MPKPVFSIKPPYTPELLPVVRLAVESILADGGDVFEYGSGYSTLWFAQFANVVSVEHDDEWYKELKRALRSAKLKAKTHLVAVEEIAGVIDDYDLFDLVLVDCEDGQRVSAVEKAIDHVKAGGWLLLDDSQWPTLARARKLLSAWPWTTISGMHYRHTGEVRDHQTSMYRKPL